MSAAIALCADATSLRHPEAIGLGGENLAAQGWLRLFSSGEAARRFLRGDRTVDEVWVASCDDVEPINLAATLKRDRADRRVCLVSFEGTGSLMSRASAAGIDASLTRQAFLERYAACKRRFAAVAVDARKGAGCMEAAASLGNPAHPHAEGPQRVTQASRSGLSGQMASDAARTAHTGAACAPGVRGAASASAPSRAAAPSVSMASAPRREGSAFLLPVVSGSGGAGKSSVSVLLGLAAHAMGLSTLLLDFDLQFGDVAEMLGAADPMTIDDAVSVPARIAALRSDGRTPALLAAPRRLEDAESIALQAPELLGRLSERFDVIVANTGAAWAEQHAVLLERSSKALFLVDQRGSSLRACRHALDLCARCGIATGPFSYAVNRCAKGAAFSSIDVSCALGGAHVFELADGGRDVEELLGTGAPFELMDSRNPLCASVERLLREMLPNVAGLAMQDVSEPRRRVGLRIRRPGGSKKPGGPHRRGKGVSCL
ncbi:chromosome partitioning protein ParA [Gordonibacter sp. An230]|uniref:AAA family ATPase n=1 Tax=Gordonibacter sp. An230 TaxID=1965592 RepID=UPI000B5800E4|nr:P-loop NTPase [Gordonibacter sp. An230]OUO92133.1 chromosome partitioning protein ParA [Gordonibacter sp. An230]